LFSDPVVANDYLELPLKGAISNPKIPDKSPYPSTPLASAVEGNRMVYIFISDKIFNDIFYFEFLAKKLKALITKDEKEFGKYLRPRCGNEQCLGKLIPEFVEKLPPTVEAAEMFLDMTTSPLLNIKANGAAAITASLTMELYVMVPDSQSSAGETKKLIALATINLSSEFTAQVTDMKLFGHVKINELDIRITESDLPPKTVEKLETLLQLLKPLLQYMGNEALENGLQIPLTKGVELENPQIRFLEHTIQVESDAKYTP